MFSYFGTHSDNTTRSMMNREPRSSRSILPSRFSLSLTHISNSPSHSQKFILNDELLALSSLRVPDLSHTPLEVSKHPKRKTPTLLDSTRRASFLHNRNTNFWEKFLPRSWRSRMVNQNAATNQEDNHIDVFIKDEQAPFPIDKTHNTSVFPTKSIPGCKPRVVDFVIAAREKLRRECRKKEGFLPLKE